MKKTSYSSFEERVLRWVLWTSLIVLAATLALPDSFFLNAKTAAIASQVSSIWPKIQSDAMAMADRIGVIPSRIVFAFGLGNLVGIISASALLVIFLISKPSRKDLPYAKWQNLLVFPAATLLLVLPLYFMDSFVNFSPSNRSARVLFNPHFIVFAYLFGTVISWVGLLRTIVTYLVLLFQFGTKV
jgi:hypothetical protein